MVFEHFENGGDIPPKFVHEKEKICDKYESSRVYRKYILLAPRCDEYIKELVLKTIEQMNETLCNYTSEK